MAREVSISDNKTLKLTNVLILNVEIGEGTDPSASVYQMENYIKSKGATPVGPLIQKSGVYINDKGQPSVMLSLMRQTNNFIHNVELPYRMESILRIKNCMYAHYVGPEECLKFAHDKIRIKAFEDYIELSKDNYTIFIAHQNENLIADVFVEKIINE